MGVPTHFYTYIHELRRRRFDVSRLALSSAYSDVSLSADVSMVTLVANSSNIPCGHIIEIDALWRLQCFHFYPCQVLLTIDTVYASWTSESVATSLCSWAVGKLRVCWGRREGKIERDAVFCRCCAFLKYSQMALKSEHEVAVPLLCYKSFVINFLICKPGYCTQLLF